MNMNKMEIRELGCEPTSRSSLKETSNRLVDISSAIESKAEMIKYNLFGGGSGVAECTPMKARESEPSIEERLLYVQNTLESVYHHLDSILDRTI